MNRPQLTSEKLQKLVPLRNFSEAALEQVRSAGKIEHIGIRKQLSHHQDAREHIPFLLQGKVQRTGKGVGACCELDEKAVEARFPLHCPDGSCIDSITLEPCWVLWIPRNLLTTFEPNGKHAAVSGLSVQEGSATDEIFVEFYEALSTGRLALPGLPDQALRLDATINQPDSSLEDVAQVIQLDPALAARLVNVANSAAYAGLNQIKTLKDAVMRLGLTATRHISMGFILRELFQSNSIELNRRMRQLWAHSVRVGVISYVLAEMTPGLNPDTALLAGLVHDIGKLPMLSLACHYPALMENANHLDQILDDLRAQASALTLRKWGFGEPFISVALESEYWYRDTKPEPDYADLVLIAQLHSFIGTPLLAKYPALDSLPAFHKLANGKLDPRLSRKVVEKAQKKLGELERMLMGG